MLEQAYNSVSVAKKMPLTEENLREVIKQYTSGHDNAYHITSDEQSISVTCPSQPFELINRINAKLGGQRTGYKFLNGMLIIPL